MHFVSLPYWTSGGHFRATCLDRKAPPLRSRRRGRSSPCCCSHPPRCCSGESFIQQILMSIVLKSWAILKIRKVIFYFQTGQLFGADAIKMFFLMTHLVVVTSGIRHRGRVVELEAAHVVIVEAAHFSQGIKTDTWVFLLTWNMCATFSTNS